MMITVTVSHPLIFLVVVVVLIMLIAALVAGGSGGRGRQAAARRLEEEVRASQQRIAQIGERTRAAIIAEARRRQGDGQNRRS
jgi:hypothetical protein